MRRDNTDLKEAIERLDMRSWLDRESIEYRETRGSRGDQLNVRECPCCGDKKFRVYLNAETGLGNCFHGDCEVKFSKWKFIRAHLGHLSTAEVVTHIFEVARELGWRPIVRRSVAVNMKTDLKLPVSVSIPIKGRNLKYLSNRNIGLDQATYFSLRYCHRGHFAYEHDGRQLKQFYNKRVIIPIFDLFGDLVSFQGRDITGEADKKYLFPPGFASTGEHLFNGQNAWGAENVLVGEGAFDVIAQKIALDEEPELRKVASVGTFGKHLSVNQIEKFVALKERGLKTVTFMWDGERQAYEDAIHAALSLNPYGFKTRVATLPKDCDPNEVSTAVVRSAYYAAKLVTTASATKMLLDRQYR